MADTTVDSTVDSQVDSSNSLWGPYWIDVDTAVLIYNDSDDDIQAARTTDAGANWSLIEIDTGTVEHAAAWFDQETPGDTGTLVHVVWMDGPNDTVEYRTIDVSDGSLGTLRTVATPTVDTSVEKNRLCVTKSRNGNLYVGYLAPANIGFLRSVNAGADWTTRADLYEAGSQVDFAKLFPANTGDDADVCAIYWDRSANQISVKMHDDSANSWTETSITGGAVEDPIHVNMDGSIRHSDSHLLMAFHSNDDNPVDDLRTVDITVDSIASPTITAKTDVFTNQGESAQTAVFINQQNDDVYVAYCKGNPTWTATTDIVFHISTDGMGAWGSEQAYSELGADDNRIVAAGRTVGDDGGRYQPAWANDDLLDIYVNEVNDIEIAASAPAAEVESQRLLIGVGI